MIHCELCGGLLMVRPGGKEARCQSCGLLYPMEELKAMLAASEDHPAEEQAENRPEGREADHREWHQEKPGGIRQEQRREKPGEICREQRLEESDAIHQGQCPTEPVASRPEQPPAETGQTSTVRHRTEEEEASLAYFDYLFRGAFPDLQIRQNVPASELGGESWCVPVDFLFSRNGRNLLAVCICDQRRWKNKPIRGTEQAVQQEGIPFMRFIRQFANRPEYVIPRASRVLYPDGIYVPKTE